MLISIPFETKFYTIPMSSWSPMHAMGAYVHSLQLCKEYYNQETTTSNSNKLMEPKLMEYISALAAGNQARLIVDVGSGGASPITLGLAVAAQQTGGRLICLRSDHKTLESAKKQIENFGLAGATEFAVGHLCEAVGRLRNVDFAVIDPNVEECMEVFLAIDMNPRGSIVVVSNIFQKENAMCTPLSGCTSYIPPI